MRIALQLEENGFGRTATTNQRCSRTNQICLIEADSFSSVLDIAIIRQRQTGQQCDDQHELSDSLMAAMTLRWTERGLPVMRAPAAAGWPPPPNWAAMSFTFTSALFERRLVRVNSGSISSKTQATTTGAMARIWSMRPSESLLSAPVRARSAFLSQK